MTLSTVRVGVIGLGTFGDTRVAALSRLLGVEVGAVCSRRAERAAEVASRYGVPRCYTDWGEFARDPFPDAVVVATAEHEHLQPAVAAIQAGKYVLVEKPLATAPADAHRIASAATSAGTILISGHTVRFETRYTLLKEHPASGALGDVVAVQARRNRARKAMQPTCVSTRFSRQWRTTWTPPRGCCWTWVERIEAHVLSLGAQLIEQRGGLGQEVMTPREAPRRTGNIAFVDPNGGQTAALLARDACMSGVATVACARRSICSTTQRISRGRSRASSPRGGSKRRAPDQ